MQADELVRAPAETLLRLEHRLARIDSACPVSQAVDLIGAHASILEITPESLGDDPDCCRTSRERELSLPDGRGDSRSARDAACAGVATRPLLEDEAVWAS